MSASCSALAHVASLMPTCTASEHRVLTAIALQVGDLESSVKLSLTELEQLTGLSRSGVRKGLEDAKASGHLKQAEDGNSFAYSLCHVVTQNVSPSSTKRVTKKHTPGDTCVTTKHKSLHEVTHPEEGAHLTELKERSDARAESPEEAQKAYSEVAYAAGYPIAEWLRDKRSFNFTRAYALWGDQLENLWRAAVHFDSRKPGDKAKFRFQDACEGDLDLGIKPPGGGVKDSAALLAVEYGDVVRHPEHGEWLVDRIDPVAQKCEQSEKYFWVPISEVTVVRRRSDCYA